MSLLELVPRRAADAITAALPSLISSVGERQFGSRLLEFLHHISGAEHAAVFYLTGDDLVEVTTASLDGSDEAHQQTTIYLKDGLWRRDPTLQEARSRLHVSDRATVRTDIPRLPDETLRNVVYGRTDIRDRVLICTRTEDGIVGLSILRSSRAGSFSAEDLEQIHIVSAALFALLAKHINITWEGPNAAIALTSLAEIEACISHRMPSMPRREAEVCGRAIYGISTLGISLDLGISSETVMTYRKRAYSRLGIATQRELFLWYLEIWSSWPGRTTRYGRVH